MSFMWIWEQTAIISLYIINWLVCITEAECLLRGTDWVFVCNSRYSPCLKGEFANYETSGYYMYRQFNIQQFYVLPT